MKAISDPWLSVIVPSYNGQAYLDAALQSVFDQRSEDIEIIAVDDGSTDATRAILQKWTSSLRLQVFVRPHAGNWVANTNHGLEQARGKYVCFLHQDDLWMPGRMERLRAATVRHPDIGLFLHPSWFIDDNGHRVGALTCPLPRQGIPLPPKLVLPRLLIQNFIAMPAPLFKREAALKAGLMDERLWFTADWKLWLALASQGPVIYLPDILAGFRIHLESQTMIKAKESQEISHQTRLMLDEAFPKVARMGIDTRRAERIAKVNIELNAILAARAHGQPARLSRLVIPFLSLGPISWYIFFRDSRIIERVVARWRAGLATRSQ